VPISPIVEAPQTKYPPEISQKSRTRAPSHSARVRWAVMAETVRLPALAAIEPLHGLTFALLHLTCMRLLAECVPRHLAATALTIYGTVAIGAATTLLTLVSGPLYAHFGAHGFWVMAALCATALPLARTLREPT
jgi:PPP family 3-phenylpropionic acid transporter